MQPYESPTAYPERPTNVRWTVFALGCGTSWMMYLHRYTFALIKPELAKQGLKADELGLMDSVFAGCYTLFQFPSGVIADVFGAHLYLSGAIIIWSIALAMHTAPYLSVLYMARALLGTAQAGAFAALSRVTRTWFPLRIRTFVQGWMGVFAGRMGGLSASLIFATLMIGVLKLPWQTAVYILAGVGVALGFIFLKSFRNTPREHAGVNEQEVALIEAGEAPSRRQRMPLKEMFRRMSPRSLANLGMLNVSALLSTMADNLYSNWIPLFLFKEYALNFKEMGIFSALPLLGGALGGVFGGFLNDLLLRGLGNRRWARSLVGCGGKCGAALMLMFALSFYDNPYLFCALLFSVKFFADTEVATRWGTVTDIGGQATASVFSFNNSVAAIGQILAPLLFGVVAVTYGWYPVFVIAAGIYMLGGLSWLLIDCTVPLVREDEIPTPILGRVVDPRGEQGD